MSPNSPHALGSHVAISLGYRRADRKEKNSTFSLCVHLFFLFWFLIFLSCPSYSFSHFPLCISPAWSWSPWRLSLWDLLSVCSQDLTFNSTSPWIMLFPSYPLRISSSWTREWCRFSVRRIWACWEVSKARWSVHRLSLSCALLFSPLLTWCILRLQSPSLEFMQSRKVLCREMEGIGNSTEQ